jgi:hypothetical protein
LLDNIIKIVKNFYEIYKDHLILLGIKKYYFNSRIITRFYILFFVVDADDKLKGYLTDGDVRGGLLRVL